MYEQYIKLMERFMQEACRAWQCGNTRQAFEYEGLAITYLELALEY